MTAALRKQVLRKAALLDRLNAAVSAAKRLDDSVTSAFPKAAREVGPHDGFRLAALDRVTGNSIVSQTQVEG